MCPLCGQRGPAADDEESVVAFTSRGDYHGHPALRCFVCGSGFVIRGANTEPIPVDRWSEIQARYEMRHRTAV